METVAILTTTHNQREKTLSLLKSCFVQIDKMKNNEDFSFTIYLLDNMSTDGTNEEVSSAFPQVKILRTDFKGEWNNGLRSLWEIAAREHPDFYLIIDPTISLNAGALPCLMENSKFLKNKAIIVGSISDNEGSSLLYGGRGIHGKLVEPEEILPRSCFTFDGKLVLVPSEVYKTLGSIDPIFRYRFADYDYGRKAHKYGINVVVAPNILGKNGHKEQVPIWRNAAYPLWRRYRGLNSPEGCPPKDKFIFDLRKSGIISAITHNISIWIKVLFPKRKTNKTREF